VLGARIALGDYLPTLRIKNMLDLQIRRESVYRIGKSVKEPTQTLLGVAKRSRFFPRTLLPAFTRMKGADYAVPTSPCMI
jgi:hypothetical protein